MRLFSIFLLLCFALTSQSQNISIAPKADDIEFNKIIENESLKHKLSTKSQQLTSLTVGNNYDLKYHRLEFTVDPAIRYIARGAVTTYYIVTQANTNQIEFELVDQMTVDSVRRNNQALQFAHIGNVVGISLNTNLSEGQLDSVTVYFHGTPGNSGFGSFTSDLQNDTIPIIATLSESYGARDWWPCKQTLNDKIDSVDIYITCPKRYDAGSNGVLVSSIINGSNITHRWKHRFPIAAYLISIGVSDYAIYSDYAYLPNDTIEILNYVYHANLAVAQQQTPNTIGFIELFDSLFIPYPFASEKYGHLQWNWGGGMEHQTMSYVGSFGFELTSHELAHQWFGDKVTCGSWADIWLNEGFATYCTGLCYQFTAPQYWMPWKKLSHDIIVSAPDGSVYCTDTTSINRIFDGRLTYRKGSFLLHMIRLRIGDTNFFTAIKNYLNDPDVAFGYSLTDKLKYHFEQQSGADLTEFFTDWYYGQGHPKYSLNWTQFPSSRVVIELSQQPSHESVSFFEGPLPVQLKSATHDTIIYLEHNYNGQIFDLQPGFPVDSVIVDPLIQVVQQNTVVNIDIEAQDGIVVYPNPVKSTAEVRFDSPLYSAVRFEIYDVAGRLMESTNITGSNYGGFTIDMSAYRNGMYYITVWSNYGDNPKNLKQAVKKKIVKL